MSWEHKVEGRITGVVTNVWRSPKGNFAFLTVECPNGRGGKKKTDLRCFSDALDQLSGIGNGMVVRITFSPDAEKLTAKDKSPVMVDGKEKWVTALTVRACEVEPSSAKPVPKAAPAAAGDDW
jgi:hypothetical protein